MRDPWPPPSTPTRIIGRDGDRRKTRRLVGFYRVRPTHIFQVEGIGGELHACRPHRSCSQEGRTTLRHDKARPSLASPIPSLITLTPTLPLATADSRPTPLGLNAVDYHSRYVRWYISRYGAEQTKQGRQTKLTNKVLIHSSFPFPSFSAPLSNSRLTAPQVHLSGPATWP